MNLPNKLCFLRLFLVLIIFIVLYSEITNYRYIATAIFIIAAITDVIDGYIARKKNQITDFGKFIDPLVDKILVISVMIYFVAEQSIPDWTVIVIVTREFAILGLRIISASKGIVIAASKLGKLKTQSQIIAVIFILLELPYYYLITIIAVLLTVLSGADYLWKGKDVFKNQS